jgi:hypothetical protein
MRENEFVLAPFTQLTPTKQGGYEGMEFSSRQTRATCGKKEEGFMAIVHFQSQSVASLLLRY